MQTGRSGACGSFASNCSAFCGRISLMASDWHDRCRRLSTRQERSAPLRSGSAADDHRVCRRILSRAAAAKRGASIRPTRCCRSPPTDGLAGDFSVGSGTVEALDACLAALEQIDRNANLGLVDSELVRRAGRVAWICEREDGFEQRASRQAFRRDFALLRDSPGSPSNRDQTIDGIL